MSKIIPSSHRAFFDVIGVDGDVDYYAELDVSAETVIDHNADCDADGNRGRYLHTFEILDTTLTLLQRYDEFGMTTLTLDELAADTKTAIEKAIEKQMDTWEPDPDDFGPPDPPDRDDD